jgi:hypothetical protein
MQYSHLKVSEANAVKVQNTKGKTGNRKINWISDRRREKASARKKGEGKKTLA